MICPPAVVVMSWSVAMLPKPSAMVPPTRVPTSVRMLRSLTLVSTFAAWSRLASGLLFTLGRKSIVRLLSDASGQVSHVSGHSSARGRGIPKLSMLEKQSCPDWPM